MDKVCKFCFYSGDFDNHPDEIPQGDSVTHAVGWFINFDGDKDEFDGYLCDQ